MKLPDVLDKITDRTKFEGRLFIEFKFKAETEFGTRICVISRSRGDGVLSYRYYYCDTGPGTHAHAALWNIRETPEANLEVEEILKVRDLKGLHTVIRAVSP